MKCALRVAALMILFSFSIESNADVYLKYQLKSRYDFYTIVRNLDLSIEQTYQLNRLLLKQYGNKIPINSVITLPIKTLNSKQTAYRVRQGFVVKNQELESDTQSSINLYYLRGCFEQNTDDIGVNLKELLLKSVKTVNIYFKSDCKDSKMQRSLASAQSIEDTSLWKEHKLSIAPFLGFYKVNGIDQVNSSVVNILSNTVIGGVASWNQSWNDEFDTSLRYEFTSVDFLQPTNTSTLNAVKFKHQFSLKLDYHWLDFLSLHTVFGLNQRFFIRGGSSNVILETQFIPEIHFGISSDFLNLSGYQFSAIGLGHFSLSGSSPFYSIQSGLGFFTGLAVSKEFGNSHHLGLMLGYERHEQDSSAVRQSESLLKFSVIYQYRLGQ